MKNRRFLIGVILISFAFGIRNGVRFCYLGPLAGTHTESAMLITVILSMGALFGIFLHPIIGKRSDRTWTRFGRRYPYIMVSIPLMAITTIFFPHAPNYFILLVLVILEAIFGILGFSPLFSLIPDNFDSKARGKASAVMMIFIGLGAVCSISIGSYIWDTNHYLLFYAVSLLLMFFGFASFFFVKEKPFPKDVLSRKTHTVTEYIKSIFAEKAIALYFAGDFFRWFSLSIVAQLVTLFANKELGIKIGMAGQVLVLFNLVKLLSALPVGMTTDKIDRKKFLLAGIIVTTAALGYGWFTSSFMPLAIVMGITGIGVAITVISGSALLMDLFPLGRSGEFLGVNMVFVSVPSVISMWVGGVVIDAVGTYRVIFLIAVIGLIISYALTRMIPTQNIEPSKTNA